MLIHIEIYSTEWTRGEPPQQQFHASLATSKSNDRLLTIGRKDGDVLLTDKSVSREHVILKVASTINREKTYLASTPEEKAACEEDDDGLCLVLHNVGKLGTYLCMEEDREHNSLNNGEDSSGTDETDDEEAIKASQKDQNPVMVSAATKQFFHGKPVRLKEISSPLVLKALSKNDGRVVLQCGKLGTTIVLTRKVIEVLVSGTGPHGYSDWKKANFYKLGLRQSSRFVLGRTSMVLSQKRKLSLHQISAWSRNLPIVTFDYLYAYVNARKSLSDPLFPLNPKDYEPAADTHQFWGNLADPKLLSSCTLLSTAESDMKTLAEAAGATVEKLYDEGSKTSTAEMVKRAQLILDSTPHCFGLFEKRPKKVDTELQGKAELRLVKSEDFVFAIMEQVLPRDTQGELIGRMKAKCISSDVNMVEDEDLSPVKEVETDATEVADGNDPVAPPLETDDAVMMQDDSDHHSLPKGPPDGIVVQSKATESRPASRAPKLRKIATASGKGWFRAAPMDRRAYIRSKDTNLADPDSPVAVALTDICTDLILPNQTKRPSRNAKIISGPDFRAFRKNRILSVPTHSQIELRSVLPREVDQLIEDYEEQEVSLAKQRMRTDDLFRDAS
ncbi:hypothetical protein FisN_11Lh007 [Fistulifera solaris]|uniref:Uncharacterized protein n=1 Tax=Fistulifera solaris TaxID=1519565 RepID=A0A1Z5J858_FISSO|nr:hypothetical protein FisN_11Lh007 [Fistulifera solaris]|eukprot:GAX09998.1 hypothetical protein FisN_11Lh007 [Fistulifera solaris]